MQACLVKDGCETAGWSGTTVACTEQDLFDREENHHPNYQLSELLVCCLQLLSLLFPCVRRTELRKMGNTKPHSEKKRTWFQSAEQRTELCSATCKLTKEAHRDIEELSS